MTPYAQALDAWMPRLIDVWRGSLRVKGPAGRFLPGDVDRVARGVRRLSEGLTRGRRLVGAKYMDDPELLGAYLLYFWPVSYLQGRHVLGELGGKLRTVLDLASGPGPLAFAALDAGAQEVWAADRSERALDLAKRLATASGQGLQVRKWDPLAGDAVPGAHVGFSAILVGHALNELWSEAPDRLDRRAKLCVELAGMLRKGGSLAVVEPALRTTTRELLGVRDRLVAQGHAVRAPCLYRGACPALERDVDWCHAERPWEPPGALGEIIAAAGLHKEALKMAYAVFAPKGEAWSVPPPGRLFRIVSEHLPGHGRLRAVGCGPEGRLPLARSDEARGPATDAFDRAGRGDLLAIEGGVPAGEGPGVRLLPGASVKLVAHAWEPLVKPARG